MARGTHDRPDRLAGGLDAALLLLDRQVIDSDGRMVAKVDDVELTEYGDGDLAMSGLLTGSAALVPRLGGPAGEAVRRFWGDLGRQYADRGVPGWIGLEHVETLDSALHLNAPRDGLIVPQPAPGDGRPRRRLGRLLGLPVEHEGRRIGQVVDVRLDGRQVEQESQAKVVALMVGHGRPGARLGYDRHPEQGPRLLSLVVRALHRHRGLVAMADADVDWEHGVVTVRAAPERA
ncbi:MAG: hypothetical protein ACTHNS_04310 [Marmoricola sp.]